MHQCNSGRAPFQLSAAERQRAETMGWKSWAPDDMSSGGVKVGDPVKRMGGEFFWSKHHVYGKQLEELRAHGDPLVDGVVESLSLKPQDDIIELIFPSQNGGTVSKNNPGGDNKTVDRLKVHLAEKEPGIEERLDLNVGQIERIVDLATEDGTPVLVALFPDENQLNPALRRRLLARRDASRYDFSWPQPALAERLNAIGVEVLDLLPVFASDPRCLFMNDTHWTEEGHVLVAEALRDWLKGRLGDGPP